MSSAGATLLGSFSGATGTISDRGFRYRKLGTSEWTTVGLNSTTGSSGSFSKTIGGLSESTTYEYQAFVTEFNASTNQYEDRWGAVKTFTTLATGTVTMGYLDCYEVPSVSLNGTGVKWSEVVRGDKWYRYYTSNSKQQVASHSFTHPTTSKQTRNYTVLYDGNKYAPVWVAYAMHKDTWGDRNQTGSESWMSDPALSLTQQTGLDNASSVGYSRGHMVSSQERKTSSDQNGQTYFLSNQAPQWQNGFNNGLWSTLEQKIVSNAPSGRDTLYVVTGVLYEDSWYTEKEKPRTLPSGSLSVPIPSHFYKCLMLCSFDNSGAMTNAKGIAYVYTNEAHTGENYYDSKYVTTINEIEFRSGLVFFPKVSISSAKSQATPLWTY